LILLLTLIRAEVDIVESVLAIVDIVWIVAIIVHRHLIGELLLLISHVVVILSEGLHWWLVHMV
jgi:hypothetical protein